MTVAVSATALAAPSMPILGLAVMPLAIGIFLLVYALILSERVNRALVALAGAGLMIFAGVLNQDQAIAAIDFNTLGLLLGMMVIVGITKLTGLFEYLALRGARLVQAKPLGLLIVMNLVTMVGSALMGNVTTILLVGPIALAFAQTLKISPLPFIVSSIFAANVGGFATIVGDPTLMLIGSATGFSYLQVFSNLAPLAVLVNLCLLGVMVLLWRKQLVASKAAREEILAKNPRKAIKNKQLLMRCLVTLGLVLVGFLTTDFTGLKLASVAMAGAVFLGLWEALGQNEERQHHKVQHAVADAEWVTLLFFVGLFVLVTGLIKAGVIDLMASYLLALTGGDVKAAFIWVLWGSAILSAFVDNVPYVATMIPLLQQVAPQLGTPEQTEPLWWALAAGACLGGNGTIIGASSNLVMAGLAAKQNYLIGFVKYLQVAFPLMLLGVAIATGYFWVVYL
jgi:Na+/H+ antiporter NhaD/arsenite permease-like protein